MRFMSKNGLRGAANAKNALKFIVNLIIHAIFAGTSQLLVAFLCVLESGLLVQEFIV